MNNSADKTKRNKFFGAKVTVSVILAVFAWQAAVVTGEIIYSPKKLIKPAYLVGGVERPIVDIAELRRSWPTKGARLERERVKTFMVNIKDTPGKAPILASLSNDDALMDENLDLPTRLANADPDRGKRVANKCKSCHTFENGGANKTGPNLWDLIGSKRARSGDFSYTSAMKSLGGQWTFESLFDYLADPEAFVPGTEMNFKLPKARDRADLIAFLRQQSSNPVELPVVSSTLPEETMNP